MDAGVHRQPIVLVLGVELMTRIDDGNHICPIMTRAGEMVVYCTNSCAVLQERTVRGETTTYCGMMPPDSYVQ